MAEHTRFHSWFNTVLACIAIGISASSAFISWKSYSLNVESVGLSSNFTYDYPLSVGMSRVKDNPPQGFVGFCWQVTIANQSAARVTIVNYDLTIPSEGPLFGKGETADVLDRNGHTLTTPISFEGGEACQSQTHC